MIPEPPPPLRPYINRFRRLREEEEELARSNPFLAEALATEKHESHRLAVIARTIALVVIMLVLPLINPHPSVILYEIVLAVLIALGWLQLRFATVGRSGAELALIVADFALMTAAMTIPNPWSPEPIPAAYLYQFDNFIYLFVPLAIATLAFSWRTVWSIGTIAGGLWLIGATLVALFGREVPQLTTSIAEAIPTFPIVASEIDPNSVRWPLRFQEVIVFMLVAGILALKGWRSNRMLIKQAVIAGERANLSRYFPASLVDTLASTDHDIGAVRSQEIAVLFADIVGFTKIAESSSPEEVMKLLRDYHAVIERAIFQNNGTLDKYLGDGVMATFGTPTTSAEDAVNALHAAQQIVREVDELNDKRNNAEETPFTVSVGVHFGPAILGDIGPERRMEFAVVGDTVNVASRIEATTRELGCTYAVSDDLMKRVHSTTDDSSEDKTAMELKKGIRLRGRETPIDVWINKQVA